MNTIHILGISGSLRKTSKNTGLLRAAQRQLPAGVTMEIADLSDVPIYNPDKSDRPEAVDRLFSQAERADAFIFACPEYNFSLAPALKNALDWMSRETGNRLLNDKAAAIVGAAGASGSARVQYQLRQVGVYLNLHFLNKPEVMAHAFTPAFNEAGEVVDPTLEKLVGEQLVALVAWTKRLKG